MSGTCSRSATSFRGSLSPQANTCRETPSCLGRLNALLNRYDATVVDIFPIFAVFPNQLISSDCVHPGGLGYQAILSLFDSALP